MPVTKFTKEQIVQTACEIVRLEGLEALNARRLAKELGGSVQPIYHNFETMDDLTAAVMQEIIRFYAWSMDAVVDVEHPYLAKGMSYVKFAREYPEFFKLIFMSMSEVTLDELLQRDLATEAAIATIGKVFVMSPDEYKDFHTKIWIFTHGIACLLATKTLCLSDDEVKNLLVETTHALYRGLGKGDLGKGQNAERD